jgi:hypothetical protein
MIDAVARCAAADKSKNETIFDIKPLQAARRSL